jgi:hypothetical protein
MQRWWPRVEGPPVPGEDGIAIRSKEDVHRAEEIWPALLHQRDLSGGSAGGVDHPLDCVGQPKGVKAQDVEDDEELQEMGSRGNQGTQQLRRLAAGSGDHPVRWRSHLLWPRAIRKRGEGA